MRWWTKSLQTSVWASKGEPIMTDIAFWQLPFWTALSLAAGSRHPHPRPRPGRALLHPGLYPLWGPGAALPDGGALLTRSMEKHYKKTRSGTFPDGTVPDHLFFREDHRRRPSTRARTHRSSHRSQRGSTSGAAAASCSAAWVRRRFSARQPAPSGAVVSSSPTPSPERGT